MFYPKKLTIFVPETYFVLVVCAYSSDKNSDEVPHCLVFDEDSDFFVGKIRLSDCTLFDVQYELSDADKNRILVAASRNQFIMERFYNER